MINENIKAIGTLRLTLTDKGENVKIDRCEDNIITTIGKSYIAQRISLNTTPLMGWMAIGTSNTVESAGNTQLGAELPGSRQVAVPSSNNNVANFTSVFLPGIGTGAIVEAAVFNDALFNSGIMLNRVTFAVINKDAADTLTISWNITVA
jgi:hypothetical protein